MLSYIILKDDEKIQNIRGIIVFRQSLIKVSFGVSLSEYGSQSLLIFAAERGI